MCVCAGLQNCRRATLKAHFQTSALIQGVAWLDDAMSKIYAVCRNWNTINVFHALPPYEQLRGIHVSGLKEPTDIVACNTNRLLYVSDRAERCVWQVTTGGKTDLHLLLWTPTKRKASAVLPVSLSVRLGRLIVVEIRKISVYDTFSDKTDEIGGFSDSVTLHHAVETDHRSVLVALSDRSVDLNRSAVRKMELVKGEWLPTNEWNLNAFRSCPANIGQPLYMAWGVCGNLYVAIHDRQRILVLDSSLKRVRCVRLSKRSTPSRLCFLSRQRKQFLIVDVGFGVDMYDGVIPSDQYPKDDTSHYML